MTDATTADDLAAVQLIKKHGLSLFRYINVKYGWSVEGCYADTLVAAVRAWAEAAGVPWPSVNVVPMWAVVDSGAIETVKGHKELAECIAIRHGGKSVPCEVVIRTETERV